MHSHFLGDNMKIIGLCGGSGCGKGMVSSLFLKLGIPSIDTDLVYKEITSFRSSCIEALIEAFGESIANDDGSLNREVMRSKVFFDQNKESNIKLLNQITHKFILSETRKMIDQYEAKGKKAVIVDAPLLFESEFDKLCDVTVAVIADEDKRINRIMSRDGISYDHAKNRINSQLSTSELIKKVDLVIDNNGDVNELSSKVTKIYDYIKENYFKEI